MLLFCTYLVHYPCDFVPYTNLITSKLTALTRTDYQQIRIPYESG